MLKENDKTQLLVLGFIESKIKQADSDLQMYSLMRQEILQLLQHSDKVELNNRFLRLVTDKKE